MKQQLSTEARLDSARACLEAYGGDLSRWPEDARAAYGDILPADELALARRDAEVLDDLLASSSAPATPHDLKNRITAGYVAPAASGGFGLGAAFSGLTRRFRLLPAGALAGLSALGFAIGVMTESASAVPPEYEAYAYLEAGALGNVVMEEGALWDAE